MADIFGLLFPDARAGQLKNEETRNRILDNNRTRENVSGLQALLMGNAQTEATGNSPGNYVGPQSIDPNSLEGQQQMMGLLAGLPGGASAIAQGLLAPPSGRPTRQQEKLQLLQENPELYEKLYPQDENSVESAMALLEFKNLLDETKTTKEAARKAKAIVKTGIARSMGYVGELFDINQRLQNTVGESGLPFAEWGGTVAKVQSLWARQFEDQDPLTAQQARQVVNDVTRAEQLANTVLIESLGYAPSSTNLALQVMSDGKYSNANPPDTNRRILGDIMGSLRDQADVGGFEVSQKNQDVYSRIMGGGNNAASRANIGGFPQVPLGK